MENDINSILASKRDWRKAERRRADRRVKDGTSEERKDTADVLRAGRNHSFVTPRIRFAENVAIMVMLSLIVLIMAFVGHPHAYTAGWYGAHERRAHALTASGQVFNENAFAGASWAYPLGSRVLVTNIKNNLSVEVVINDRGPARDLYLHGRVMDLTRAAFAQIAPLDDGVIHITVKRL